MINAEATNLVKFSEEFLVKTFTNCDPMSLNDEDQKIQELQKITEILRQIICDNGASNDLSDAFLEKLKSKPLQKNDFISPESVYLAQKIFAEVFEAALEPAICAEFDKVFDEKTPQAVKGRYGNVKVKMLFRSIVLANPNIEILELKKIFFESLDARSQLKKDPLNIINREAVAQAKNVFNHTFLTKNDFCIRFDEAFKATIPEYSKESFEALNVFEEAFFENQNADIFSLEAKFLENLWPRTKLWQDDKKFISRHMAKKAQNAFYVAFTAEIRAALKQTRLESFCEAFDKKTPEKFKGSPGGKKIKLLVEESLSGNFPIKSSSWRNQLFLALDERHELSSKDPNFINGYSIAQAKEVFNEIFVKELYSKSPSYVTNVKSTFVGDVHAYLPQITKPLLDKQVVKATGEMVFIDLETLQRIGNPKDSKFAGAKILEIPELVLNPDFSGDQIIFLGDYIDHGSVDDSLKCFCLLADLLEQQEKIKQTNPEYESIVSIVGNHELHPFFRPNDKWNLGNEITIKEKFINAVKILIRDGKMKVSHARGGILSTHSVISQIFLEKLLKEVGESDQNVRNSINYFLTDEFGAHKYKVLKSRSVGEKDIEIQKLQLDKQELPQYQAHLQVVSDYINKIAKEILPKYGTLGSGKVLATHSVLFVDQAEGNSKYTAIGPFWARPNMGGNVNSGSTNHVVPVKSIQSAYGHHKMNTEFGRSDFFIEDDGSLHAYEHIACFDGGASSENTACYVESDENGLLMPRI